MHNVHVFLMHVLTIIFTLLKHTPFFPLIFKSVVFPELIVQYSKFNPFDKPSVIGLFSIFYSILHYVFTL